MHDSISEFNLGTPGGIGPYIEKMVHHYGLCKIQYSIGLLLKLGLVKNKTEAYLLCVNTLIIISVNSVIFVNFH